jgi:hypothetical protein
VLGLGLEEAAGAPCPENTLSALSNMSGTTARTSPGPRDSDSKYDQGRTCTDYCLSWLVSVDVAYDLVAGTMHAYATGSLAGIGESSVSAHDVFTLLGPPSATPVTFHARAHVWVAAGCGYGSTAQADASIREGASNGASATGGWDGCFGQVRDLDIGIARASGSSFDLYFTVHAFGGTGDFRGGGGDGYASLSLSFPDLPAGYSVVSCQGFAAGQVTATRRSSWGAVKSLYR